MDYLHAALLHSFMTEQLVDLVALIAFDARLRHRLLTAADALPAPLDELDDALAATAHGDA